MKTILFSLISILLITCNGVYAKQSHLIVISGLGGSDEFSRLFQQQATKLIDSAHDRLGLAKEHIFYLAKPYVVVDLENEESIAIPAVPALAVPDKDNIKLTFEILAQQVADDDEIFIFLLGHGSVQEQGPGQLEALFNIPGRDISAQDFAQLLAPFTEQKVIFINTTAASGGFIKALSAPNRVIVTATASGTERYYAQFGRFFIDALAETGADIDKDKRVSMLEAFHFARLEVQRSYTDSKRLQTEHALLDDDGDGEGSLEPDIAADSGDGLLARAVFLGSGLGITESSLVNDPTLTALLAEKQQLEDDINALRSRKDTLDEDEYQDQLEELLIELALKNRAIQSHTTQQDTDQASEAKQASETKQ